MQVWTPEGALLTDETHEDNALKPRHASSLMLTVRVRRQGNRRWHGSPCSRRSRSATSSATPPLFATPAPGKRARHSDCLLSLAQPLRPDSHRAASISKPRAYLLTARAVGALRFRITTLTDVRAAFGAPTRTWRAAVDGFLDAPIGLFAKAGVRVSGYRCQSLSGHGCWTFFLFESRRLVGFWTQSPAFKTAGGTRVGTPLRQARRNDGGRWSGTQFQISALIYQSRNSGQEHVNFKAYIDRDSLTVTGFFVSRSPAIGDGG